jgi:hypothetical protein
MIWYGDQLFPHRSMFEAMMRPLVAKIPPETWRWWRRALGKPQPEEMQ